MTANKQLGEIFLKLKINKFTKIRTIIFLATKLIENRTYPENRKSWVPQQILRQFILSWKYSADKSIISERIEYIASSETVILPAAKNQI